MKMSNDEQWDHVWKYKPGSMVATGKDGEGPKKLCYLIYDILNYKE